jgi:Zn-dependent peptidase ImmA (M78 family)
MNRKKIRQIVKGILDEHSVISPPIDVTYIAKALNIELRIRDFAEDLSGFAYQKNGEKVIGVNAREGRLRQRFTIAHELGHIFLDPRDDLNVDKNFALKYRNGVSSQGVDLKEMEANYFAAELLMPEDHLKEDINAYNKQYGGVDFEDDELVKLLAGKYEVSMHAMSVRLASLHYI